VPFLSVYIRKFKVPGNDESYFHMPIPLSHYRYHCFAPHRALPWSLVARLDQHFNTHNIIESIPLVSPSPYHITSHRFTSLHQLNHRMMPCRHGHATMIRYPPKILPSPSQVPPLPRANVLILRPGHPTVTPWNQGTEHMQIAEN
jgi:hypothetical protein